MAAELAKDKWGRWGRHAGKLARIDSMNRAEGSLGPAVAAAPPQAAAAAGGGVPDCPPARVGSSKRQKTSAAGVREAAEPAAEMPAKAKKKGSAPTATATAPSPAAPAAPAKDATSAWWAARFVAAGAMVGAEVSHWAGLTTAVRSLGGGSPQSVGVWS